MESIHNKIETSRVTKASISEVVDVVTTGYQINHKEGAPDSKPYFPENYSEDVESGNIRLFLACEDKEVVGSVQYEDREGSAYLSQMTVHLKFRKRGIGARLLKTAEASAKTEGFKTMQLTAMVEKDLPNYYKKLGYAEVGIKERPRYTLIVMEKSL
jgi:ribosomal protein S18 acetylase RimI-like enzyme